MNHFSRKGLGFAISRAQGKAVCQASILSSVFVATPLRPERACQNAVQSGTKRNNNDQKKYL